MSESRYQQRHASTHAIQINRATRGALRESLPATHFGAVNLHSAAVRRLSVDALSVLSRSLQRAARGYRQRAAPAISRPMAPSARTSRCWMYPAPSCSRVPAAATLRHWQLHLSGSGSSSKLGARYATATHRQCDRE